jgi:hypothetical protein
MTSVYLSLLSSGINEISDFLALHPVSGHSVQSPRNNIINQKNHIVN